MFREKWEDFEKRGSPEVSGNTGPVFLTKAWAPLILSVGLIGLLPDASVAGRLILGIPMALAVAFHLSLALVEVREGRVWYRRFRKWVSLDLADVVSSGTTWRLLFATSD